MADKQTILTFERSASFLRRRADRRRREGRFEDALVLYRRAAPSADPHGSLLSMADMLCDMGRPDQALRELGYLFAENPSSPEGMYILARCLILSGKTENAKEALVCCLNVSRDEDICDKALEALARIRDAEPYPAGRREQRALKDAQKAYDALMKGDMKAALSLAGKSLARENSPGVRVLYNLARAYMHPDLPASVRICKRYVLNDFLDDSLRLAAAALLPPASREAFLDRMVREMTLAVHIPLYISAAAPLAPDRQRELFTALLGRFPHDRNLLNALAVSSLRAGRDAGESVACWQRMLAVDPGDVVAAAGCLLVQNGAADPYSLPLLPVLTRGMHDLMRGRFEEIIYLPAGDRLPLLRWAFTQPDRVHEACRIAYDLLPAEAEALLRGVMLDMQLPRTSRVMALGELAARSAQPPMTLAGCTPMTRDPLSGRKPERLTIPAARTLKYMLCTVCPENPDLLEPLTKKWLTLNESPQLLRRMASPRAAAAALSLQVMKESGCAPSVKTTAARFGCTPRRVKYCLNILKHHIREDDTDHETDRF